VSDITRRGDSSPFHPVPHLLFPNVNDVPEDMSGKVNAFFLSENMLVDVSAICINPIAVHVHFVSVGLTLLWSSGQSPWLQIQRFRVRCPVLPDFLRSTGIWNGIHSAS
jgi:hypothetical protein